LAPQKNAFQTLLRSPFNALFVTPFHFAIHQRIIFCSSLLFIIVAVAIIRPVQIRIFEFDYITADETIAVMQLLSPVLEPTQVAFDAIKSAPK